ncbi:MAG: GNAT family N-acetyltransferase [Verrucomicrobiota bacterium]
MNSAGLVGSRSLGSRSLGSRSYLVWIETDDPRFPGWVAIRQEILRDPLGLEYSPEDLLAERDDSHLLFFDGPNLLGGLIVRPTSENETWKIRQVAVAESTQGRGIGRILMNEAMRRAQEVGISRLLLHAREDVIGFYEVLGFKVEGEPFNEVSIPHRRMSLSAPFRP